MTRVRLYFDEDAMQHALVVALRARQVDVVTASDRGMIDRSDADHLRQATSEDRAVYSFNICDFVALHGQWTATGKQHAGIVLGAQQRYSVGEQMRRLLHLLNNIAAERMRSRLEYLSNWGR
jgi:hypothetical protein